MALFSKTSLPRLAGIDISSDSVKLLELSQGSQGYTVESYAVVPLAPGSVVDHEIKEIDQVSAAVRELVQKSRTKTKQAAIALAGASVITKTIQMPTDMSDSELEQQIRLEANRYIPYPIDEVSLDFEVLDAVEDDETNVNVLLAACRTEQMDVCVDLVQDVGLSVQVVDVEPYALERACSLIAAQLEDRGQDKTVLLVDVGSRNTTLTVLHDLKTIYMREEEFGGYQLTQNIQTHYGVSFAEAGRIKKQSQPEFEDLDSTIFSPFRHSLVAIVERSLQFFYSATAYSSIDQIVLAGGSARVPGMAQFVSQQMSLPTVIANPFTEMRFSSRVDKEKCLADASALMVACGLALRSFS